VAVAWSFVLITRAYHSCLNKGGLEFIKTYAPFKSKPKNQWLSQGYYFWLDRDDWAISWNKDKPEGNVVILYNIHLDYSNDNDVFDLLGNGLHSKLLSDFAKSYMARLKTSKEPSVGELIEVMRKNKDFNFKAIRVADKRKDMSLRFLNIHGRSESLDLGNPIQLCVFDRNLVEFKKIIHPNESEIL